ncbi:DNA glycosylase/AP lyase [Schizophyllum amplum]|uniref:DNA glycosylase/AP lyase n=1 Tax=Schizophyllum amplum TaxID=97359 RepID=A0A550CCA0_9AGAR|nr:DNA glycosylase/AP lyase [Auriculariopsis ampla]
MPELPDVERAVREIRLVGLGKEIARVDTHEDAIVYTGVTHQDFADEVSGRIIVQVGRYGKVFYLLLSGEGRMPVLHFGMTGMIQVKGGPATYYKSSKNLVRDEWPPRFMKFILHFSDGVQLAFMDARRLGRIRLCLDPLHESPISKLGFDPLLCMPSLDKFAELMKRRSCPVKALLLDQKFSAGVGNWVADEILYHARVHPERRCNTLTETELDSLHRQTETVCRVAVDADADEEKFPEDWLFKHRWDKGKKNARRSGTLKLPSGAPATIKWTTVGGRTSAYIDELQKPYALSSALEEPLQDEADAGMDAANGDSVLTELSDEPEHARPFSSKRKKIAAASRPRKKRAGDAGDG